MATVTVSFTLDDQYDRDIIGWLAEIPKRKKSAAIREALRGHLRGQSVTFRDLYQALQELNHKLESNTYVTEANSACDAADVDEPPDVAVALDNLGL
jgi:hypothetical protein